MATQSSPKPKDEAMAALDTARRMLDTAEPMTGVRMVQLRGLIEYAQEQVGAIQEIKRMRRDSAIRERLGLGASGGAAAHE